MSFILGKQETTGPQDVMGLRQGLIKFLGDQGFETGISGMPKGGDLSPFMDLFKSQLNPVLAQAKESAGSLTGSGLGNIIGATAGRSTSDFLLNLLRDRANRFSGLLGSLATGGVGGGYQPGFLDYFFQGLGKAAPALVGAAGGGGGGSGAGPSGIPIYN